MAIVRWLMLKVALCVYRALPVTADAEVAAVPGD